MNRYLILFNIQSINRIFIHLVLCAFFLGNHVQAQQEKITGEIKWASPKEIVDPTSGKNIHILYFEHAVYNNPNSHLPYYQSILQLGSASEKINVQFTSLYFEEIKPEEARLYAGLTNLSDSIAIISSIGNERKQPVLIYSFIPLRKNATTGKIERLRYFSLKIERTAGMATLKSTATSARYSSQSVLNSGDWYKFYVSQSGVYQITYNQLKSMGISNPADVRIYGNGGKVLPEVYSGNTEDDLKEIPIRMEKGSDGIFNDGDYILFYAEGPVTWSYDKAQKKYAHHKHPYIGIPNSDNGRVPYFITTQSGGARVPLDTTTYGNPSIQVNSFDALAYHETNQNNLLQSGSAWYGESFSLQTTYDFSFTFPNIITTEPVQVESAVLGRSSVYNYFNFNQSNNYIGSAGISPVDMGNSLAIYAQPAVFKGNFNASTENISLEITYNNGGDASGSGWLRFIRMVARENLTQSSQQFNFRDSRSVGSGNIAQFTISNYSANTLVWDISDINNPIQMNGSVQNNSYSFSAKTDSLREFVAFNTKSGLLTPEFIQDNNGKIPNQNLHALNYFDMLIISHPDFLSEAQRLADLHAQKDGISYVIVTPDQIYNEFSSGKPDPAAIRNFVKMFYDRAASPDQVPKYLLLFGDGSYDNRVPFSKDQSNTNFIITYESANSLDPTNTFVSDDYFGMLVDNESIVNAPLSSSPYTTALLDIGIGRLPVDSIGQAIAVVNKIEKYMNKKSQGDWRNSICFVGDDEDDNIHMEQADDLASYVAQYYPTFNIEKIYLDAYQEVSTSTGDRYPDVNLAILNQLNKGLLIFNYTGHGGESGLAQEQIMQQNSDIRQWKNDNYPLFVTATCDFARFDRLSGVTAGEDVLLNPNGGGIGLLTTNRLVYSAPNFVLNQQFYDVAFVKSSDNKAFRLGDIIRKTKNGAGIDINKLNFALLGDPALSLAFPKYSVVTDSVDHKPLAQADTLKAYGSVTIKGHIEDENGAHLNNYQGVVVPVLFDKSVKITTLANDGGTPFEFNLQDKVLFKGKSTVKNGEFTTSFILPRDMDYNYGFGRLSYYANDSTSDAAGYYNKITVGGINTSINIDTTGPKIKLYMNDTTFLDGGITDAFPTLLARVFDDHGINPGGNSLGHDITATLDNDPKQVFILNSYFQADIDNYRQGSVAFKFPELSPGKHTVTFKVWDIFNNSSQAELNFVVVNQNSPSIQRVYNYPNPFSDNTNFFFEHNQTAENLDVTIEIYGFSGNKIREIHTTISSSGFTSGPINWDGRDGNGNKIISGIYIYRIVLRSLQGTVFSNAKKMVVIRQ